MDGDGGTGLCEMKERVVRGLVLFMRGDDGMDLRSQGLGLDGYTANERENANQCLADENDV